MKICPSCKINLNIFKTEGKEIYGHPVSSCQFSDDGLQVKLEIVDELLFNKFQELVVASQHSEDNHLLENHTPKQQQLDLLGLIQKKLAKTGNIQQFDEILTRLKIKEI